MRAVLDTNCFDRLLYNLSTNELELIRKASKNSSLELYATHVQLDELSAIPSGEKATNKFELLELFHSLNLSIEPTAGFIIGISSLGFAKLGSFEINEKLALLQKSSISRSADALIAVTAWELVGLLITDDKDLQNPASSIQLSFYRSMNSLMN